MTQNITPPRRARRSAPLLPAALVGTVVMVDEEVGRVFQKVRHSLTERPMDEPSSQDLPCEKPVPTLPGVVDDAGAEVSDPDGALEGADVSEADGVAEVSGWESQLRTPAGEESGEEEDGSVPDDVGAAVVDAAADDGTSVGRVGRGSGHNRAGRRRVGGNSTCLSGLPDGSTVITPDAEGIGTSEAGVQEVLPDLSVAANPGLSHRR